MNIIKLAQEAELLKEDGTEPYRWGVEHLEHFAELVAAAEREACAKVCEAQRDARIETHPARVEFSDNAMSLRCAAAIRARGEK